MKELNRADEPVPTSLEQPVPVGYGGVFALQAGLPPKNSGGPINGRIVTFALDGDLSWFSVVIFSNGVFHETKTASL